MSKYFDSAPLKLSDITDDIITSRIYICEHLFNNNLTIYNEYRRLLRAKIIAKVSTRKSSVFIYETSGNDSRALRIDSVDFLRNKFPEGYAAANADSTLAVHKNKNANIASATDSQRPLMITTNK